MTYAAWLKYKGLLNTKGNRALYDTRYLPAHRAKPAANNPAGPDLTNATPDPTYGPSPSWTGPVDSPAIVAQRALLKARQDALSGQFDGDRLQTARDFRDQMVSAGLWNAGTVDPTETVSQATDAAGNNKYAYRTFGFDAAKGGQGGAYRTGYRNATNNASSRGFGSSSDRKDAWASSRAELNQRQADALNSFGTQQRGSVTSQGTAWDDYTGQISGLDKEQLDYRAGQSAPIVQLNAAQTQNVGAAPPGAAANAVRAQTNRRVFNAGALPGEKTLKQITGGKGYKKTRAGNGKWVIQWT